MVPIFDLDDSSLKRIYTLACKPPFKSLDTWKLALSLARTNYNLFSVVYPSLFKQVFVECTKPCIDPQSLLSFFSPDTNDNSSSTSLEHCSNVRQTFSKNTNAGLFIEYGYLQYATEINIVIDAPMYSVAHIAEAMRLLAMGRHLQWSSVRVLRIEFRYSDGPSNGFKKKAHSPELLANVAGHFVSCLPSITKLQIVAENSHPIDCTFATVLVKTYTSKCVQIRLNFEIPFRIQRLSNNLADLEMVCTGTQCLLPFYEISTEYLTRLKLSAIPYNAGWASFSYTHDKEKTVFSSLSELSLSFACMPDGARLYMRKLKASKPVSADIRPNSKTYASPQPLSEHKPAAIAGNSRQTTDTTIQQFRREHKYMDDVTRILNYRNIEMPELRELKIKGCPPLCQMLLSKLSCPKLVSFTYSGAFGGLQAFDFEALPCLQSASLAITSTESDEIQDLYRMLNCIYGKDSTAVKTSLSLKNMDQPLNPMLLSWPKLKHLKVGDAFDFNSLITLLSQAPILKELVLPRLTIYRIYDLAYLLRNKRALVLTLLLLSNHPLENLNIQYYAAGSRSTSFDFVIRFIIHMLKHLRDLHVNPEVLRYFKQLVFVSLYPSFQNLRINGITRDEYLVANPQ